MRPVRLATASHPEPPGLDTAVSHALALAVGAGEHPETIRLHHTTSIVAFGRRDVLSAGYPAAVAAARNAGFEAIERLAGGRAAVFHPGTVAFAWSVPEADPRQGIHRRFRLLSEVIAEALRDLGADARVGELPGEYCPGEYSINVGGRFKVMGIGQRLVRNAAHVGGVVVVRGGHAVRQVLVPVYRALGLEWDPGTAGDLESVVPGLEVADVVEAIAARLGERFTLEAGKVDPVVLERAAGLAARHVSPAA